MIDNILNFIKSLKGKTRKKEIDETQKSKEAAKDRLHIVLMQDRANISADFLEMMRKEIVDVIKKYIVVDEKEIDVRLTHSVQEDGTPNPPSLYANIPILNIRNDMKALTEVETQEIIKKEEDKNKKSEKETKSSVKDKEKVNSKKVEEKAKTKTSKVKKNSTNKVKEIKKN